MLTGAQCVGIRGRRIVAGKARGGPGTASSGKKVYQYL